MAEPEGGGTGFLIDEGGTIATSHQVISGARALEIRFVNGARYQKVDLLVDDADRDLALLRIDPSETLNGGPKMDAKPLTLGDSDTVVVSERAVSIGNPLGLEHTLTDGLISSHRVVEGRPWIQMSVPGSPGISGGPVFNMQGEVVGVTTAQIVGGIMGRAQNLNLAVPVNALKSMIRKDYPGRRTFGDPSSPSRW
jgi:S1-C subfamily serine protease